LVTRWSGNRRSQSHHWVRESPMNTRLDMVDDPERSRYFTQRHEGTKKGMLKTFRSFPVFSVIFV
jgi:hypothetical protein